MTNWQGVGGEYLGVFSHLWSLAVEEQFYFTWAPFLLLLFIGAKNRRAVLILTLLLNVAVLNWLELRIANPATNIAATDCRLFSLVIGALAGMVSYWKIYPREFFSSKYSDVLAAASAIAAVVLASQFSLDSFPTFRVLPWFALSVAVLTVWCANRKRSVAHPLLTFPPLVWIGQVSYGLYLWHHFFVVFVRDLPWSLSMKLSVGIAASLIVTAASYYLLERPFLRLKDRFKFTSPARSELDARNEQRALTFDSVKEPIPSHDCPVGTI
jgi:peptidoglycan/LPS O-acetylase OafA/YrhL